MEQRHEFQPLANILEDKVYRKSLLLAFHMTRPVHQYLTTSVIEEILQSEKMFTDFLEALSIMICFYHNCVILAEEITSFTLDQWRTEVACNDKVIGLLLLRFGPNAKKYSTEEEAEEDESIF